MKVLLAAGTDGEGTHRTAARVLRCARVWQRHGGVLISDFGCMTTLFGAMYCAAKQMEPSKEQTLATDLRMLFSQANLMYSGTILHALVVYQFYVVGVCNYFFTMGTY